MQFRPVNFPVEDGQLLTQREILCRECCSRHDQAPDEQKESRDEDHKGEANYRNKDELDNRADWLMISLTASISTGDGVFGRDRDLPLLNTLLKLQVTPTPGLVQHRIVWRLSEARGDLSARAPHEFLMRYAAPLSTPVAIVNSMRASFVP